MTMNWDKAAALLSAARRVLVLTHVSPDGDAMPPWSPDQHRPRAGPRT